MDASQHGELGDWLDRLFNRDDVEPRDHHVADIAPDDAAEIEVDEEPAKFIVDEPKAPMRVVRYLNWAADYPAAEPLLDQPPWPTLQANRPRGPIPRDEFVSEQVASSDEFDPGQTSIQPRQGKKSIRCHSTAIIAAIDSSAKMPRKFAKGRHAH